MLGRWLIACAAGDVRSSPVRRRKARSVAPVHRGGRGGRMAHFQRSERVLKRWDGAVLTSHVEGDPTRSIPGHGSHGGAQGRSQGNAFVKVNNRWRAKRATSLGVNGALSEQ